MASGSDEVTNDMTSVHLVEIKGDLFSCSAEESLAHCISADAHMGKGIAVKFKQLFGGVNEIRNQGQTPGGLAVLKRDRRFIYYLVTKERYSHKPTYRTLQSSLERMRDHCRENHVTKLSIPRIGCGLDRLEWPKVRSMIKETFKDLNITITVYSL